MRKALVVYVQRYEDAAIANLNKTAEEAFKIGGFLEHALPEGYQFKVDVMPEPTARDVFVWLKKTKEEFLEAEKTNPKERNLIIFVFIGHGFRRRDNVEFLLCADALEYDMETNTTGGISKTMLDNFADGFSNTDVVFWLDACRDRLFHNQGKNKACEMEQFRTVGDVPPEKSSSRVLLIWSCDRGECAKDDGLTMKVAVDIMRERRKAGEEIELGSALTEQWGERLDKTRYGNRQSPVSYGRPIILAPGVKKKEKFDLPQKKLADSKEQNAEKFYKEALNLFLTGNDEKALEKIAQALKIVPENVEYQNLKNRIKTIVHPIPPPVISTVNNPPKALPIDYLDSKGKEYRLIKAGSFWMGSLLTGKEVVRMYTTPDKPQWYDDAPRHYVTLTKEFYLAKRPVTRGEFQQFVDATGYKTTAEKKGSAFTLAKSGWEDVKGKYWRDPGFEQTNDHPVVCVSYFDALEYIDWLNKTSLELNGIKPIYRLPTESEWEYACRAGTTTEFFWGDEEKDGKGYLNAAGTGKTLYGRTWKYHFPFDVGYPATSPVGSFKPNDWNLYDMLGNVWEWTSDWYGDYPKEATTDPKGATSGSFRALRGGSWNNSPANCRCAYRFSDAPAWRSAYDGFRVAFSSK